MPRDPKADEFFRSIGGTPSGAPPPSKDGGTNAAPAKTESDSGGGDWTWKGALDPTPVAKGLVGELGSAAGYIPGIKDSETLRSVRDWAESGRDEETGGGIKRFIGESLPFMAIPELGFGTRLGTLAAKYFPRTMRVTAANLPKFAGQVTRSGAPVRAGQMAANPSTLGKMARAAAPVAGRAVERGAIGAGAGAASDTNHPLEGAAFGALGSTLPELAARSGNIARYAIAHKGRHMAAEWITAGMLGEYLGVGHWGWVYPLVAYGPVGTGIKHAGYGIFNRAGQAVGHIPAPVARKIMDRILPAGIGTVAGELFADEPAARDLPGAAPLPPPEPAAPQEAAQ